MAEKVFHIPSVYSYSSNYYVAGGIGAVSKTATADTYNVIANPSFYKCGDSLYLASSAFSLVSDSSDFYDTITGLNLLKEWGYINSDIPEYLTSYSYAYKVDIITNNTASAVFSVDTMNPIITNNFISENSCAAFTPATTSRGKIGFITKYSYSVESQTPEVPSGSFDDSNIVQAILFIPAVLIMICFFNIIFKIFVNRRTRG